MDPTPEPESITELRRGRLWRRAPPSSSSHTPKRSPHPPTPSHATGAATTPAGDPPNHNPNPNSYFSCNICLDAAKKPVVTHCGHLFCWRCLYRWVHCHSPSKDCPVCKSAVEVDDGNITVVPIYGPDSSDPPAGEDDVPPRPAGRRNDRGARGSLVSDMIEEVRQTGEVIGARVQLQALRRTTSAIDRVLVTLQALEELVERLRGIHRETQGSGLGDGEEGSRGAGMRRRRADTVDGIYRRTRRRLTEQLLDEYTNINSIS